MDDPSKTREQLITELSQLRLRIAELENAEAKRKHTEEALHKSNEELRAQYKHISIPTLTWQSIGGDFILIAYNDAAEKITQGGIADSFRVKASELYHKMPEIVEELSRCFAEKSTIVRELSYRFKPTGERKQLLVSYAFVPSDMILVHAEDITDRVRVERALRESEEKYRSFIDNAPISMYTTNLKGEFTYGNKKISKITGYQQEDWLGKPFHPFLHPEDLGIVRESMKRRISGGVTEGPYEVRVYNASGEIRWMKIYSESIYDTDKEGEKRMVGIQSFAEDITDTRIAEEALRESEETLGSIFRAAPTGIGVVCNRIIQRVNDRLCEMLGYSRAELLGQSARILYLTKEDFTYVGRENYVQIQDHGTGTLETRWRRKDGKVMEVLLSSTPVDLEDWSLGITFTALDMTERKRAEEAFRKERDRAQMYLDIAGVMFLALDAKGEVTLVNKKGCVILEDDEKQILRKNWFDHFLPQEQREKVKGVFQQLMKGTIGSLEYFENPIITKSGKERHIAWHNALLRSEKADIIGILSSGEDITERKKAEEETRRLEGQLRQAQKMEAIGTLAGGIAHDFNNILFPIMGYTEMTIADLSEESKAWKNLNQVLKSVMRAKGLVQQILTFSRQQDLELKPLKVQIVVKEALKLIRSSLPTIIEIRQDIDKDCVAVLADPTHIHQIVMNLCTNAYHAMEEAGGTLEVNLSEVELTFNDLTGLDMEPGPYLCLKVGDTGHGMDHAVVERVFDPYFTTKEKGKGTGLGLAVVHGIVKGYGGEIRVDSEPGKGTVFHIYLPQIRDSFVSSEFISDKTLPTGHERILLVDDERQIVSMEKEMLECLGYKVTDRTSSIEALEAFRKRSDRFDLIITDMTMPNMTGDKLAREVMKIRSDIPVILCTGFSEMISEERAGVLGIKGFLMKPIVMSVLAKTVREMLDND